MLDPGCCPAGSYPEEAFRAAGGKALRLQPAPSTGDGVHEGLDDAAVHDGPLDGGGGGEGGEGDGPGGLDGGGWLWRVADLLGVHREAVLAGCPVPLAGAVRVWSVVAQEVETGRWDAVVLPTTAAVAGPLVDAPELLLRVLDQRLDGLAGAVGQDPRAAGHTASLLALRPCLAGFAAVAAAAVVMGGTQEHDGHGCLQRGGLGLPRLLRHDPAGAAVPAVGVARETDGYLWWVQVPAGTVPELVHEVDRMSVTVAGQRRRLRLPAALRRCTVRAATVVGDRLEVRFLPDPDAWR